MILTRFILFLFCIYLSALWSCSSVPSQTVASEGIRQLVWADEFDYEGLPDSKKWSYDVGDGCPNLCGWGNNELEYYTKKNLENARVADGHLIIEARKQEMNGREYTSARLVSRKKGDWQYGRIEIRAQLPSGRGIWPAIWMLPTNNKYGIWPKSGEIDIMEHVGYEPDTVFGTVHTKAFNGMIGTQKGGSIYLPDAEQTFHTYSIDWTQDQIKFAVDNQEYFSFTKEKDASFEEWPFDHPFHLVMNIAVGGNWGGSKGIDPEIYPQQMLIDYVRVYNTP